MIFLFGSIKIKQIPDFIQQIIVNYPLDTNFIIGDAYGVDAAFQKLLKTHGFKNVIIVGISSSPRNFLDKDWEYIQYNGNYTARDLYMVNKCTQAFCVWNGESKGTKASINNLISLCKTICITVP